MDVDEIEIKTPENFPIQGDNNIYSIVGKIRKVAINDKKASPFNRGMPALIESLVNFSRYKMVGEDERKVYMDRLIENQRVINKVSDEKTKKAIEKLKIEYEKN